MKSKGMVYGLVALVLGIWGLVSYRIYESVKDQGPEAGLSPVAAAPLKMQVPLLYPDTLLPEPASSDPFTGEALTVRDTGVGKPARVLLADERPPEPPPENPLATLKYLGYVSGGKSGPRLGIVSVAGTERLVQAGDTLRQIRIAVIGPQAIRVSYKGKMTSIKTE